VQHVLMNKVLFDDHEYLWYLNVGSCAGMGGSTTTAADIVLCPSVVLVQDYSRLLRDNAPVGPK